MNPRFKIPSRTALAGAPLLLLDNHMNRGNLRQELRLRRQQLAPEVRYKASLDVCQRIIDLNLIQPEQKVAGYMACGSEISVAPLMEYARNVGAHVYLPQVPGSGRVLGFSALAAPGKWQKSAYGIQEWASTEIISPFDLDIVFTPLLGFDIQANRLGQGGGYYDASFAFLLQQGNASPRLFGVAYDCQQVETILRDDWDVPLHGVVTEKAYYGKPVVPVFS